MELLRALAALSEPPGDEVARLAGILDLGPAPTPEEHVDLFVVQLPPYASVYLGEEGMLGGEARDRIAGFWRAIGQDAPAEADHLTIMLAMYARLAEFEEDETDAGRRAALSAARSTYLREHLLSWLPTYAAKVSQIASGPYRRWAELLQEALCEEAKQDRSARGPAQTVLPLHLREPPPLVDPRVGGAEQFLGSLFAPVRSGLILVRSDLARAARALRLGFRLGDRKLVLQALLAQDPVGALGWLTDEAAAWMDLHARNREMLEDIADFWAERAARTASLLNELRQEAGPAASSS